MVFRISAGSRSIENRFISFCWLLEIFQKVKHGIQGGPDGQFAVPCVERSGFEYGISHCILFLSNRLNSLFYCYSPLTSTSG